MKIGPTLDVLTGFGPNFRRGHIPSLPSTIYPALVDTGAIESCIDSYVAVALGLPIIDQSQVSGVHGKGNG